MPTPSQTFSGFAFTGEPLDRADALRDDPEAISRLWADARVLVLDADGNAFADAHGQPLAVTGDALGGGPGTAIFLGLRDRRGWFCVDAAALPLEAPQRIDLRQAAATWTAADASAFAYARGMSYWQARTRFCGVCGGAVAFRRAGFIGHCAQCGNDHYPRVDPAVIVAVGDGQRLLLGRQAGWAPRRYSVIAGFVEPGESLEQTVAREVFEETRVRIGGCSYLGAQPWPFPGALMLGFQAQAAATERPQVDGELEDARWFEHAEIGAAIARDVDDDGAGIRLPPPISIARSLIEHWHRTHG
ncbi:MAG TPA: NAD(+) diphosphatase [Xanthomonadaceae bacterium]|nr:NAD(+) diphosphatase [Xanthomonadaceae bacterium]